MSNKPRIYTYKTMRGLANRLRDDCNNSNFVLFYAYNRTGKTRLSMEFKEQSKKKNNNQANTLYFNAFTEDLFSWDNDLDNDNERKLKINSDSKFFKGLKELALETKIKEYLDRYADFNFDIDYQNWFVSFSKDDNDNIKISRGEENIFIWCIFLAIVQLAIDKDESYNWVKYLYIDDPISSLDDNNAIAVASDLAKLLKTTDKIKTVISSHHSLFFNVICNELKKQSHKKYFLHRISNTQEYKLRATDDTPFFHHVAMLDTLQKAVDSSELYTYHFNILRSVLEKTATFFGFDNFAKCLDGAADEALYNRALNLLSHGKYSVYEPKEMLDDNKKLFKEIFEEFLNRYQFDLPQLHHEKTK